MMPIALTSYFAAERNIPFISMRYWALALSALTIAITSGVILLNGFNLGIDFKGGTVVQVSFEAPPDIDRIRSDVSSIIDGDVQVVNFGAENDILVKVEAGAGAQDSTNAASQELTSQIESKLRESQASAEIVKVDSIGGKVSGELGRKALVAISVALVMMLIYIWIRFEWQFSLGAVVALMHDILVVMGLFTAFGFEINLSIVAAGLTIIGYSMNDTVVVYDRIRENLRKYKSKPLKEVINKSINQTLSRTMLTSVSTLIALLILFFFGGPALSGFTFAMILGILIGTYSSIFIASPLLLMSGINREDMILPSPELRK